ncbi:MAG: hypothetical protein GXO55_07435 [Chloroflexi bacterium]|nr:hypothetical protein [Chloroflexota bacterium]
MQPNATSWRDIIQWAGEVGTFLHPPAPNQILVRVDHPHHLTQLVQRLREEAFYLVTVVANDERELEDHCFKIYYVFSHPEEDLFLIVEYLVEGEHYPSLHALYPAMDPFEREMRDLMGLIPHPPRAEQVQRGSWLHRVYPPDFYPLRRDVSLQEMRERMAAHAMAPQGEEPLPTPRPGHHILPVGPIHAGHIEPGRFLFEIGGEVIEDVTIRLGYAHKGVERLFQSTFSLNDGWRLAEDVAGDSPFAHSLAYCHAVETLTQTPVPRPAEHMRGILLELERIYNHITDLAALAHDVALELYANELFLRREHLLRLNQSITGSRFLRGVNRVGGVVLPHPLDVSHVRITLRRLQEEVEPLVQSLVRLERFRDRSVSTGILAEEDARRVGATGLVARASGVDRDYRRLHPWGIYRVPEVQGRLAQLHERIPVSEPFPMGEMRRGDVHARFLTRAGELFTSLRLVLDLLDMWERGGHRGNQWLTPATPTPANDYAFALGYAEGWRGDVIYWVMQDKLGSIYRCKVRDPSMLNWPALRLALIPHVHEGKRVETILPDFPLVNKSFNLSYSGNDL